MNSHQKTLISPQEVVSLNSPSYDSLMHYPICNPFSHITYSTDNQKTNQSINTKSLQYYSKKCETVLFRCDWISVICSHSLLSGASLFDIPNDTNSADKIISWDWFTYVNPETWEYIDIISSVSVQKVVSSETEEIFTISVSYEWNIIPICRVCFYSEKSRHWNCNHYKSKIDIYWKAFRLEEITGGAFNICQFLICLFSLPWNSSFSQYLSDYYITRFDYKFDFFTKKWDKWVIYRDIMKKKRKTKNRESIPLNELWDKKDMFVSSCPYWILTPWGDIYTGWTAWTRKNQYIYTRMYHKQVEIYSQWHTDMYKDYLNYQWEIWRLEFEFGSRFCSSRWKIYLFEELEERRLSAIVFEYIWISAKTWFFNAPYLLKIEFKDKSALNRRRMYSAFRNTAKTYNDNSINPLAVIYKAYLDRHSIERWKIEFKKNPESLDKDIKELLSVWNNEFKSSKYSLLNPSHSFSVWDLTIRKLLSNDYSKEDLQEMFQDSYDFFIEFIKWYETKSIEEKFEVYKKLSEYMKKHWKDIL